VSVVAVTKAAEIRDKSKNIKINDNNNNNNNHNNKNNNNNNNFITIRNLTISNNYINHKSIEALFCLVATLFSPLPTLPSGQKKVFVSVSNHDQLR